MSFNLLIRILIFIIMSVTIMLIALPCFVKGSDTLLQIYSIAKTLFSSLCHQLPEKSYHCNSMPLLVCARCTGIYAGLFFASLLFLLFAQIHSKKMLYLFFAALLLIIADAALSTLNVYSYSKTIATLTGFFTGFTGMMIIEEVIIKTIEKYDTNSPTDNPSCI